MYQTLEKHWKVAFDLAFQSLLEGSIPIGAVIMNEHGEIVSTGRNLIFDKKDIPHQISNHPLAHAEINAILKIENLYNQKEHVYHIYTTMEPCPLCFGAILMSDIYHLYFAAKDPWAGSTNLRNDYIRFKRLHINGPYPILSDIQLCIQGFYELSKRGENHVVKAFEKQSHQAIHIARLLQTDDLFLDMLLHKTSTETLYNYLYEKMTNS